MFTTFNSSDNPRSANNESTTTPVRRKRNQVGRACDRCRLNRIKCDDHTPCKNCQLKGGKCSNSTTKEARTLPSANREIERLKSKVSELENQLTKVIEQDASSPRPASSHGSSSSINTLEEYQRKRWRWEGVRTTDPRTTQTQYYGPSSSFYFMHRLRQYLKEALQNHNLDTSLQQNPMNLQFASPSSPPRLDSPGLNSGLGGNDLSGANLSRAQEEHFLNLFWQSYHYTIPIIDENDFKQHYNSLWSNSYGEVVRKPSALVDIVLGLCMQYGFAFIPRGDIGFDIDGNDSSIAGRWLYRRCQMLLSEECEVPTIPTLQCRIFSAIYLLNASFLNMAHKTLAVAIRTAHMLGLHLEPPEETPEPQRILVRRIWWVLVCLDGKSCMRLGRPFSIQRSEMTCAVPTDDTVKIEPSGNNYSLTYEGVSWLGYYAQCVKLIMASRAIHLAFYERCAEVITANEGKNLYDDPDSLEICAGFLLQGMKMLQDWVRNVPDPLKSTRRGTGEPFSTTRSALEIDLYIPLWLQRQRLLLELLYHNLSMTLCRPFIRFRAGSTALHPISAGHSVSCLNHAIASTNLIHQVLSETDILNGWHEAYEFQWDATLSILGFSLSHPVGPRTLSARKATEIAIINLEHFGVNNLAAAASAATVTRNLNEKIELLINNFSNKLTPSSQKPMMPHHHAPPTPPQQSLPPYQTQSAFTQASFAPLYHTITPPDLPPQSMMTPPEIPPPLPHSLISPTDLVPQLPTQTLPMSDVQYMQSMNMPMTTVPMDVDFSSDMFTGYDDMPWLRNHDSVGRGMTWGDWVKES
ncbi:hypothetical protein MMC14_006406 [Varicellaria rhodocarpa]|nr:hypothetical protein [Varicellaria rhodocarpa]